MLLTGKHTVNAPINKIWSMLMDPDVLARITPAITSLVPIDSDNFTAIADVKIGPIKGRFTGTLKISERVEPTNFNLGVQQNSPIGNAAALMAMTIKEISPEQTEVGFAGDVRLSGTLAVMGGRVLVPVANMLSKMFFTDLQKEIDAADSNVQATSVA